ncbi:uncharacterized protein LOC128714962 [Anopheles marshallii]|uniref:uncharacterized protein LOC128714962 n=1 Tax=Anopheles marshallii TaxID=1521116 RepID=UPI00237A9390|nr:uncharacterized protein LOC128714962 [Anopheles marshallii]
MNSNYVKKCTEVLLNIPAHKPATTNIAAAGVVVAHTDPSYAIPPQQPQTKTNPNNNRASKKASQRGRTAAGGGVGAGKRPIWRHPGAGPVAGFGRPVDRTTNEHKFVRPCCPSRRPDTSHPGRDRVDCRWEEQVGQSPPTHVPHTPTTGDMIADPIQEGRGGGADNVNHPDGIGQTNVETPSTKVGGTAVGRNRPPEECHDRQPVSWSGILSKASSLPAVSERKDGTNCVRDSPECPNCQLLQRNWQDERHRHAQESAQLTEQINYLQKQLRVDAQLEQRMGETIKARYASMEQDITKLKLAVDEKNSELVLINDLKRNLKETQSKLKRVEQQRSELEKRLMVAQLENKKLELFLDTQTLHLRKVKTELSHIHTLSVKQIEFLDEPSDALIMDDTSSARRHRHPSMHNYAPTVQSSECDTTTTNASVASPVQSLLSLGTPSKDHHTTRRNVDPKQSSSKTPRIALEAATKRKSHSRSVASTTYTMEESIPSLASDSDRDNAARVRGNASTSSCTVVSYDDNGKHNECAAHYPAPEINRADHDDNRIRHHASASVSDYNAGRRKLTAARQPDDAVKWQRDDKEHHLTARTTTQSCAVDEGDKYGHRAEWFGQRTVTHDDRQQFVVEIYENITLPVSPRPFQHNLSIAPLSEDDPDDSLTSAPLS